MKLMRAAAVRCRVRTMEAEDIPQVLDIERQSFTPMWPQTVYNRELKNRMARYFVACEPAPIEHEERPGERGVGRLVKQFLGGPPGAAAHERIIGNVGLWCMVGEGHIVTIAVRPELRRQGVGELLLVTALHAARDLAQDVVTLEYRISNTAARTLYDKYGFEQVGVRTRYYSDNNEDAVLMTTPPLRSLKYRRVLAERFAELANRWGDDYPLDFHRL
jgi:[ribosomal protein S18]-alanine N-acetyltransferase